MTLQKLAVASIVALLLVWPSVGQDHSHDQQLVDATSHDMHAEQGTWTDVPQHGMSDFDAIRTMQKALYNTPANPLEMEPVVTSYDYAVSDWLQGGMGARALLRKTAKGSGVHLCAGAGLKNAGELEKIGVPANVGGGLAEQIRQAETDLPLDAILLYDRLDGTMIVDESVISADQGPREEQISFQVDGQRIDGTLRLPAERAGSPVVLLLNGFGGTRNDLGSEAVPRGLMGETAHRLAQAGFASLIIDFRGTGTSEGKFEDITVEHQIADAKAALQWLQARDDIDGQSISVLGYSLGGIVTTAIAGRDGDAVKSIVLWNPGINPPAAFTALLGLDQIRKGLAAGQDEVQILAPTGDELTFRGTFFESLYRVVPAAELARYQGPVLVAVGTKDALVFPQPASAKALLSYHAGEHSLWVRDVDHGFNIDSEGDGVNSLIDATVEFLSIHGE